VLDFGTGSLSALQRYASLTALDAVLLTHLHADHMFDACSYVVVRRYAPDGPYPVIPLYGPPGSRDRLNAAYGTGEGSLDDVYRFHDLKPGVFSIGPFTLTVDRVNHPVETFGVRVEHGGRVLAYSADTAMCESLNRLAQGADLFLCEASYLDGEENPPDLHLTGREAGESGEKAGVSAPAYASGRRLGQRGRRSSGGHRRLRSPVQVARPGARFDV
jgi:ribonuclease BN (tRNA processing enzyme)